MSGVDNDASDRTVVDDARGVDVVECVRSVVVSVVDADVESVGSSVVLLVVLESV